MSDRVEKLKNKMCSVFEINLMTQKEQNMSLIKWSVPK